MKALRTSLITAGLLATLAGSAMAQMGPGGTQRPDGHHGPRMEKMREHMAERHQRHLAELKTRLKLQPDQESAWKTFADAMQAPVQASPRPELAAMQRLTTPERIDQMQAHHAQREAEMKKRADATKAFYAGLNPEQKKTFDAETAGHMAGGHGQHIRH